MYIANIEPNFFGTVTCPHCNQRDPLLWNSDSETRAFEFDSAQSLISRDCEVLQLTLPQSARVCFQQLSLPIT
jgi:hypothetical protein